jgi:hypothetical protein
MRKIPWQTFASEIYLVLLGDAIEIGSSRNPGRMDSPGGRTSGSRSDTKDGRIRRWAQIDEMDGKYLKVILLPDRETDPNAFFDRTFEP